jgi:hypothetical protein
MEAERGLFHPQASRSRDVEPLGEGQLRTAGMLRLILAHHVNHFDAATDHARAIHRLEPQHWANPPFDGTMVLLNAIAEALTVPDPDRLKPMSRAVPQTAFRITRYDRLTVRPAATDDDPLGPAMPLERLAQKPLAKVRFRRSLSRNSIVSPLLSTTR